MALKAAPTAVCAYSSDSYWDGRYAARDCSFDWFYDYSALQKIIVQFLPRNLPCLHVGCGNSRIQEGLALDGFLKVTNVDISEVVIEQLLAKQRQQAPAAPEGEGLAIGVAAGCAAAQTEGVLEYLVADCRDMAVFSDGSFGSCIDKGTLDAVLCSRSGRADVVTYTKELDRVLAPGAVFMLISLGAPAARLNIVRMSSLADWALQIILMPKPLDLLKSEAMLKGTPVRSSNTNNRNDPIDYLGPWSTEEALEHLQTLDLESYFFMYLFKKPVPSPPVPDSVESPAPVPAPLLDPPVVDMPPPPQAQLHAMTLEQAPPALRQAL